jgi:hypothetical protein
MLLRPSSVSNAATSRARGAAPGQAAGQRTERTGYPPPRKRAPLDGAGDGLGRTPRVSRRGPVRPSSVRSPTTRRIGGPRAPCPPSMARSHATDSAAGVNPAVIGVASRRGDDPSSHSWRPDRGRSPSPGRTPRWLERDGGQHRYRLRFRPPPDPDRPNLTSIIGIDLCARPARDRGQMAARLVSFPDPPRGAPAAFGQQSVVSTSDVAVTRGRGPIGPSSAPISHPPGGSPAPPLGPSSGPISGTEGTRPRTSSSRARLRSRRPRRPRGPTQRGPLQASIHTPPQQARRRYRPGDSGVGSEGGDRQPRRQRRVVGARTHARPPRWRAGLYPDSRSTNPVNFLVARSGPPWPNRTSRGSSGRSLRAERRFFAGSVVRNQGGSWRPGMPVRTLTLLSTSPRMRTRSDSRQ